MTSDKLKEKVEKKQSELKELQNQLKQEELAQKKAEEFIRKLETVSPEIGKAVQAVLDEAELKLPAGKQIVIIAGQAGLLTNIVNGKFTKRGNGNGGAKAITSEGQQISWAKLCEIKNITRTPGGSAHRDVYNRARELHDSIEHECSLDGKVYPIVQS